jgi:hypothetical protein
VSLTMIGIVTMFVGEVAALLGCALGISDSLTAITFVALGTSLPDTFASKQAVEDSPNADAAIGNVTGSNSVRRPLSPLSSHPTASDFVLVRVQMSSRRRSVMPAPFLVPDCVLCVFELGG